MTNKQMKQAAVVALLVWWFWPRPEAQAQDVNVSIRTDDPLFPGATWRDYVFY